MIGAIRTVVVDDHSDIRVMFEALLSLNKEFRFVGSATNGAEAITVARACQPDLVLLDVVMPVMDGVQALPYVRAELPATSKVVILTELSTEDVRRRLEAIDRPGRWPDLIITKSELMFSFRPVRELFGDRREGDSQ